MHQYSSILGPVDNAFYYVDNPETPMNIGSLAIYEGEIDYEELVRLLDARLHHAPRYRHRVIQAPLNLGQPTWIADPDFYIRNHVKRTRIPAPGTEKQLREVAGRLMSSMLNRNKPLWEVTLIEGLKGQSAIFFKVHHCMVDGLAAVELFSVLVDFTPDYKPPKRQQIHDPVSLPNPFELFLDSIGRDMQQQFKMLDKVRQEVTRMANIFSDPARREKMFVALAHLINNNMPPIQKLPINGTNTGNQSLVWAEFPLDEIHAIRSVAGASVNEVMLTILARAIDDYVHFKGGSTQPFLRALVPVNMRHEDEKGEWGNRVSVMPVDIPFNVEDPLNHLLAVRQFSQTMKESSLAYSMDLILTIPSLLPAALQAPIWAAAPTAFSLVAHTWCTNVAAMPMPVYLMGHEMKHVYGYFPLNQTMGLACVIISYNGRITMTLVMDNGIVDNAQVLEQGLVNAYHALRRAAHLPELQALSDQLAVSAAPRTASYAEQPRRSETARPASAGTADTAVEKLLPASDGPQDSQRDERGETQHEASPEKLETLDDVLALEPVSRPQPASSNGVHRPVPAAEISPLPVKVTEKRVVAAPRTYRLFSSEWAVAIQGEINESEDYRQASTGWNAGPLAFVMLADAGHGFPSAEAVLLELNRGHCREARKVTVRQAVDEASFVIQGDYAAWMDVLKGRVPPLVMLTRGRLQLKKGALLRLLPFTRSATELVACVQRVPWE